VGVSTNRYVNSAVIYAEITCPNCKKILTVEINRDLEETHAFDCECGNRFTVKAAILIKESGQDDNMSGVFLK